MKNDTTDLLKCIQTVTSSFREQLVEHKCTKLEVFYGVGI
jgi:hypothetical protein